MPSGTELKEKETSRHEKPIRGAQTVIAGHINGKQYHRRDDIDEQVSNSCLQFLFEMHTNECQLSVSFRVRSHYNFLSIS